MTTTVTIGAGEKVWEILTPEDNEALLDWFRRNGLDPADIRHEQQITIADGIIDFWGINPITPPGATVAEVTWTDGELPNVHMRAPVVEDMEPGLAERVQALWVARVEKYAGIAGEVAAAHARADAEAKVRRDAGL